jgi:hypothetical protein
MRPRLGERLTGFVPIDKIQQRGRIGPKIRARMKTTSCATSRRQQQGYTGMLRLLFWGGMAAVHAPALIASWNGCLLDGIDGARLGACLGLSASMVFFGLKLWNVEFLRFQTSAKSLALMTVAVVLLHGKAIQRSLDCVLVSQETPIAATTLLSLGLKRVQRALVAALSRSTERLRQRSPALSLGESTETCSFVPRHWILTTRLCTPRAPPA